MLLTFWTELLHRARGDGAKHRAIVIDILHLNPEIEVVLCVVAIREVSHSSELEEQATSISLAVLRASLSRLQQYVTIIIIITKKSRFTSNLF